MTFNKFCALLVFVLFTFYFFKIVLCTIYRMIKKTSWKYDQDNNQELQLVSLLKNGVLQVLSSWENL